MQSELRFKGLGSGMGIARPLKLGEWPMAKSKSKRSGVKRQTKRKRTVNKPPLRHCAFAGCSRTTTQPWKDGWSGLEKWGPHIKGGWYCPEHAEAIDEEGDLDPAAVRVLNVVKGGKDTDQ